jgi:hypothetical protein
VTTALILDDSPGRTRSFRRELVGTTIHAFDRAGEAMDWLRSNVADVIFLDFDLHEYGLDIEDSGSGLDVAHFLCQHSDRHGNAGVVIHSLNRTAGPAMARLLRSCGYRVAEHPFIWQQPHALAKAVDGSLFPPAQKTVS